MEKLTKVSYFHRLLRQDCRGKKSKSELANKSEHLLFIKNQPSMFLPLVPRVLGFVLPNQGSDHIVDTRTQYANHAVSPSDSLEKPSL